jgi:CDP-diacylglycerol---serine O-phosphatidyltransferase
MAMRKVVIVPTLLTLGNAVCGLASIAYASRIGKDGFSRDFDSLYLAASGWFILAAMVFDSLDGFTARLFKSTGRFGAELDSLCDAVSFGVAPAFLLLQLGPRWDQPQLHQLTAAVATLYLMCTILRLARYNVESLDGVGSGKKFRGLPSPAAAGCLASLAVFCGELPHSWPVLAQPQFSSGLEFAAVVGALFVAILMVSRVGYPHLTKSLLRGRVAIILAVPAAVLLVFLRELAIVLLFWAYALVGFGRHLWARAESRRRSLAGADERLRH